MARKASSKTESTANLGFEQKLWLAADKLRNNMDAAEYKHVVLGLIFLKYISDSFEEHHARLTAGKGDYRFSPDPSFAANKTASGSLSLAVLAAETKVNLDKTMFQEAAGTAARLKQGCPYSQYYILNEYLDMELTSAIADYIDHHNQNPKPFVWTASADAILGKVVNLFNDLQ